jgi:hypothetical protein
MNFFRRNKNNEAAEHINRRRSPSEGSGTAGGVGWVLRFGGRKNPDAPAA